MSAQKELRALDAQVAERVMGWMWVQHAGCAELNPPAFLLPPDAREVTPDGTFRAMPGYEGAFEPLTTGRKSPFQIVPPYSTDVALAWQVLERVCGPDYLCAHVTWGVGQCECSFRTVHAGRHVAHASAENASLAICRAALAVIAAREKSQTGWVEGFFFASDISNVTQ